MNYYADLAEKAFETYAENNKVEFKNSTIHIAWAQYTVTAFKKDLEDNGITHNWDDRIHLMVTAEDQSFNSFHIRTLVPYLTARCWVDTNNDQRVRLSLVLNPDDFGIPAKLRDLVSFEIARDEKGNMAIVYMNDRMTINEACMFMFKRFLQEVEEVKVR